MNCLNHMLSSIVPEAHEATWSDKQYLVSQINLAKKLDMSIDTLRKWIKTDPLAPQPIKLGTTRQAAVFYVARDVEIWIQSKLNSEGSNIECP